MIRSSGVTLTDLPIICWQNLVTAQIVVAESDPNFPASNVANPSTALKWKHDATDSPMSSVEYFTIDVSSDEINYVAIAGHNFASAAIKVGLELVSYNSPIGAAESLFEPTAVDDDAPLVFLFATRELEAIRIIIEYVETTPAEMAVVYAGTYLVLEEGIQASHAPLPFARVSEVVNGKSENGAFLGRIITSLGLRSTALIANMEQDFFRDEMAPFLEFATEFPFFWLWSPLSNPGETAFAWLENDPQPSFDVDGYVELDLSMRGIST